MPAREFNLKAYAGITRQNDPNSLGLEPRLADHSSQEARIATLPIAPPRQAQKEVSMRAFETCVTGHSKSVKLQNSIDCIGVLFVFHCKYGHIVPFATQSDFLIPLYTSPEIKASDYFCALSFNLHDRVMARIWCKNIAKSSTTWAGNFNIRDRRQIDDAVSRQTKLRRQSRTQYVVTFG